MSYGASSVMLRRRRYLIDWLQDAWQTYDALIERVGKERAYSNDQYDGHIS